MIGNEATDREKLPAGDSWPARRVQGWCGMVLASMLLLAGLTGIIYRPVMREYHALRELRHNPSPVEPQAVRVQAAAFLQRNRYLPQAAAVACWLAEADGTGTPQTAVP